MANRKLTDDEIDTALTLLSAGLDVRSIAQRMGVSKSTIGRIAKRAWPGIRVRRSYNRAESNPGTKLLSIDVELIRADLAAGRARAEIAREYGVTVATISDIACGRTWSQK